MTAFRLRSFRCGDAIIISVLCSVGFTVMINVTIQDFLQHMDIVVVNFIALQRWKWPMFIF